MIEADVKKVFNTWRLVEDERVIVDGPFKDTAQAAYAYAEQLTNVTGKVHVAVQVGSPYEQVLFRERAKWLDKLLNEGGAHA